MGYAFLWGVGVFFPPFAASLLQVIREMPSALASDFWARSGSRSQSSSLRPGAAGPARQMYVCIDYMAVGHLSEHSKLNRGGHLGF